MHIDQLLNQTDNTFHMPANWCQGRTAFGGISTALLYQAIRRQVPSERPVRAINVTFVGPLLANEAAQVEVKPLREGKSASLYQADFYQNGNVCVTIQAAFGQARQSAVFVPLDHPCPLGEPESGQPFAPHPKATPAFLEHFDLVTANKVKPFSGSDDSTLSGWMRFSRAPDKIDDAHLIALIDAWPPTALAMMPHPAPLSSMTWSLEFIHPHGPQQPDEWYRYRAETHQAAGGYVHAEAEIWNASGELVALSRQCVTIFA